MHELAAAQDMLKTVVQTAERHGAKRVSVIRVKIGERSGHEPSNIVDLMGLTAEGTIAEGATVETTLVPGTEIGVEDIEIE
jgi:Zn finger protein HypA/HybF involved in hydrogenase expression